MVRAVALGVLALAPTPGACFASLARSVGDSDAAHLYRAMLRDTCAAFERVPAAKRTVFVTSEHDGVALVRDLVGAAWNVVAHEGADEPTRFVSALSRLTADGDAGILVTGDSPLLSRAELAERAAHLDADDGALLGATSRGGLYLVGLGRPAPALFDDIAWTSDDLARSVRLAMIQAGRRVKELGELLDVEESTDLDALARALSDRELDVAKHTRQAVETLQGGRPSQRLLRTF